MTTATNRLSVSTQHGASDTKTLSPTHREKNRALKTEASDNNRSIRKSDVTTYVIDCDKPDKNADECHSDENVSLEEGEVSTGTESENETNLSAQSFTCLREVNESSSWSKLRTLMIGDERALDYSWKGMKGFPSQSFYSFPSANVQTLCSFIDKHINGTFDVVVIFAFHYDFAYLKFDETCCSTLLNAKSEVNFEELLQVVEDSHNKWKKLYPKTVVVWTVPFALDFWEYNMSRYGKNYSSITDGLNKDCRKQDNLSKYYFYCSEILCKRWKSKLQQIPFLRLNDVLFINKPTYQRSFSSEEGSPEFPIGYLTDGLKPTRLMTSYFVYTLLKFLNDHNFFPDFESHPSLKHIECELLLTDSSFEKFIDNSPEKRSKSSRNSEDKRHHSLSSVSSISSLSKSESHFHSKKRKRSSSRSRSRHRHKRKSSSHSHSHHRHRRRSHHKRKKFRYTSESRSPSPSTSQQSVERENSSSPVKSIKPSAVSETDNKPFEEVALWQNLSCLREVHDIQCCIYRRNPSSHPLYNDERIKYLIRNEISDLSSSNCDPEWNAYWKVRLEEICNANWELKKQQLMLGMQKKKKTGMEKCEKKESAGDTNKYSDKSADSRVVSVDDPGSKGSRARKSAIGISGASLVVGTKTASSNDPLTVSGKLKLDISSSLGSISASAVSALSVNLTLNNDKARSENRTSIREKQQIGKSTNSLQENNQGINNFGSSQNIKKIKDGWSISVDEPTKKSESSGQSPMIPEAGFHSDSERNSSQSDIDSDVDLDQLIENPDFLEGLKEIDEELQKAASGVDQELLANEITHTYEDVHDSEDFEKSSIQISDFLQSQEGLQANETLKHEALEKNISPISRDSQIANSSHDREVTTSECPPATETIRNIISSTILSPEMKSFLRKSSIEARAEKKAVAQYLDCKYLQVPSTTAITATDFGYTIQEPTMENTQPKSEIATDYMSSLKMLFRLSKRLGPLGLSVTALYHAAVDDTKNNRNPLNSLDEDARNLLTLVNSKLSSMLKENLTPVQRAVYMEVSGRVQQLLQKLNKNSEKFSGVNINSIALATVNKDVTQIVSFIKNTLLYHGYSNFRSEDVMNIYMEVKATHNNMGR